MLHTAFENVDEPFGLDEIESAYNIFFQKRKTKKAVVEALKPKTVFDMSVLPKESKEDLQNELENIIRKETLAKEYQKNLQEYQRQLKMKEESDKRLKKLKEELELYEKVEKPDPSYKEQQEKEKNSLKKQ